MRFPPKVIHRDISAKSTFYFFDFDEPFILPYLDLNSETGDYFSIAAIPYNDVFWTMQENRMLLTEDQRKNLNTLMQNGNLVNYKKISIKEMGLFMDTTNHATIFEEHLHWKQHKRIRAHSMPHTSSKEEGRQYNANTFNFYIQILLDITDCKDSLHTRSSTTFNIRDSYYYYPKDSISDAFINIYFDICEIERRKMQMELDSSSYSLEQIDQLYHRTKNRIDSILPFLSKRSRSRLQYASLRQMESVYN